MSRIPSLALSLVVALAATGCGGGADEPVSPPPATKAQAGSKSAAPSTAAPGIQGAPTATLTHEQLEEVMENNKGAMGLLDGALKAKGKEAALAALATLAQGAVRAQASEPDKNKDDMAGYVAIYAQMGGAVAQVTAKVNAGDWAGAQEGMRQIGGSCASCHRTYRFSKEEKAAMKAGGDH